jgi:hypothetical protein
MGTQEWEWVQYFTYFMNFHTLSSLFQENKFVLIPKIPWDQKLANKVVWAECEKIFYFFSIISFGQVNYIFHKLFGNTKHVQFRLHISPWWIFWFKMGCKFIFLVFTEELQHVAMLLKLPKDWRVGC